MANNAAKSKKVLGKDDIRSFIPFHPLRENKSDGKRLKDSALLESCCTINVFKCIVYVAFEASKS